MERKSECPDTAYPLCLERLASIEAKLDLALKAKEDTERRLRVLERRDAYVLGACAVVSFIVPLIIKKLGF